MLPLYEPARKMNRHGYSGSGEKSPTSPVPFGHGGRVFTSGESGRGFKIKTDKWEKYVYTPVPKNWEEINWGPRGGVGDEYMLTVHSRTDITLDPREQHCTVEEAP